jgi:hypothetical protein
MFDYYDYLREEWEERNLEALQAYWEFFHPEEEEIEAEIEIETEIEKEIVWTIEHF